MKDPYILLASIEKDIQQVKKYMCCVADDSQASLAKFDEVVAAVEPQTTSIARVVSAATTNTGVAKASAGTLFTIFAVNTNAAVRYLKIYNKASAPTLANDTPILTLPIPGNTAGAGFTYELKGVSFATGIAYAITTGIADNDTGATAANEIVVNIEYA